MNPELPEDFVHQDTVTQVTKLPDYAVEGVLEGAVLADVRLGQLVDETALYRDFEAFNVLVEKPCIVRSYRDALGIGPVRRGRLSHAQRRWMMLDLPGVLPSYGVGVAPDGTTYAILGHHQGRALQTLILEHGALSRRAYLPIVRQLCGTLIRAHATETFHLAIDGRSVLLTGQHAGELGVLLTGHGTHTVRPPVNEAINDLDRRPEDAFYLAPEQARGHAGDARSDVYSVCALLYHMSTGRPPFAGATFAEVVDKHVGEAVRAPTELAGVSREFELTLLRGLDKDPRRRIPSAEALLAALDPTSITAERHVALSRAASREVQLAGLTHDPPGLAGPAGPELPQAVPAAVQPSHSGPAISARQGRLGPGVLAAPLLRPARRGKRLAMLLGLAVAGAAFGGVVLWSLLGGEPDENVVKTSKARPRRARVQRTIRHGRRGKGPRVPVSSKTRPPRSTTPAKVPVKNAPPKIPHKTPRKKIERVLSGRRPAGRVTLGKRKLRMLKQGIANSKAGFGTIEAVTSVANPRWYLDNRYVGNGAKRVLRRIPVGAHSLLLKSGRQVIRSTTVVVKPGQPSQVKL